MVDHLETVCWYSVSTSLAYRPFVACYCYLPDLHPLPMAWCCAQTYQTQRLPRFVREMVGRYGGDSLSDAEADDDVDGIVPLRTPRVTLFGYSSNSRLPNTDRRGSFTWRSCAGLRQHDCDLGSGVGNFRLLAHWPQLPSALGVKHSCGSERVQYR